jgi:hypothetical protein
VKPPVTAPSAFDFPASRHDHQSEQARQNAVNRIRHVHRQESSRQAEPAKLDDVEVRLQEFTELAT